MVRCLVILLVNIFFKKNLIQILTFKLLNLIIKICKATTLLITNTSSFVCFELRLLNNIWILFHWWLWFLLNLFKCINIGSKSICFLRCHLTIMSFKRILCSISRNCLTILNIFLAFTCIISCTKKIYTASIFFAYLLNGFIQCLIKILRFHSIWNYFLINSLIQSLNIWA
jgi:hypothetical protein